MDSPRTGKYCPRCQTMTFVDRAACETCGHQFRTGLGDAAPAPDTLHRTQQFTLPPLAPRAPAAPAPPPANARRFRALMLLPLLALALGLAVFVAARAHFFRRSPAASPSPVGTWEGTLAGASSGGVRLRFVFRGDGTGLFGWRERGADAPLSGQSPLRWRPDAAGRLALTLTPPAVPDAVSDTMILLFNRRPWAWNVDRARGRLTLGNLVFTGR